MRNSCLELDNPFRVTRNGEKAYKIKISRDYGKNVKCQILNFRTSLLNFNWVRMIAHNPCVTIVKFFLQVFKSNCHVFFNVLEKISAYFFEVRNCVINK